MPAILATLLIAAFATVPTSNPATVPITQPGTVPATGTQGPLAVPGTTPAFTPSIGSTTLSFQPGVVLVPGFAPATGPVTINGAPATAPVSNPALVPAPATLPGPPLNTPAVPAPAITPFTQGTIVPGFGPVVPFPTSVPANVPGSGPGFVPGSTPGVPGFAPALVPGVVPAIVLPGSPQPPVTLFGATATGAGCSTCVAGTGTVNTNGRTTTWVRTCPACPTNVATNVFQPTFTTTGCDTLTGNALTGCCRDGLRAAICGVPAAGRPTQCRCNGAIIACPGCSASKKGLLGLLGLLGLIPLLLCCSLILCLLWLCCIRGTKKGPDTHFATYAPNAVAMPTVVEHCAPTVVEHVDYHHSAPVVEHCDYGYGAPTFA